MAGKKSPTQTKEGTGGKKPQAKKGSSPSGGMTLERHVQTANRWRENYNPLRGLVMTLVVARLEAGERGEYAELQWLYRFVEKRFPTLRALIKRWRGAMGKLDWQIRIKSELPPGANKEMAEKQQETLRNAYERIDNLREAINFLVHKEFRGYAHLNKHRATGGEHDGAVVHLEPIDQWNWVRDGLCGDWYYNQDASQTGAAHFKARGDQPITAGHPDFIIGEEEMPVNEIAVILFLRSNLCDKDWDGFIELFGIERPNVIGPPNVPKDKEDEYLEAAERIANGEGGYLPNGSEVVYPGQRSQGGAPFKERLDFIQEQLVLAGTSGQLTMLSKPTGIGQGASDEHADVFADLAQSAAREISELFQKQFDTEVLNTEHEQEPHCVYFELGGEQEEDVGEVLDHAVKAKSAGLEMDPEELSERTGYQLTKPKPQEADPNQPGKPTSEKPEEPQSEDQDGKRIANRAEDVPAAQTEAMRAALAADLQVFLQRIDAVVSIEDAAMRQAKAQALLADFDAMKRSALVDPEAARVLRSLMSEQMLRAMAGGAS
jgi:phage gp29-like protein